MFKLYSHLGKDRLLIVQRERTPRVNFSFINENQFTISKIKIILSLLLISVLLQTEPELQIVYFSPAQKEGLIRLTSISVYVCVSISMRVFFI